MDFHTIAERIRNFVMLRFPLARKQQLRDQDPLIEGGIIDSMGILEIVGFLEQDFQITVTDDDLVPEHFQTVEGMAHFVFQRKDGLTAASH